MKFRVCARGLLAFCLLSFSIPLPAQTPVVTQTNTIIRFMAANLTSGNNQSYETAGINIFKGLKPDIVAIQEFKYNGSSADTQLRQLVDTAFGASFYYYRETGSYNIPNGIVSRFPILAAGSWDDPLLTDRGFAWAQLDVPGSDDLYVVSVHLYGSGTSGDRNTEATLIKSNILANFPANAWVVVAGDFNTGSRSESAVTTFKTFLSDDSVPTDAESGGTPDTNEPRSKPYDYVLPSYSLATNLVPASFPSHSFANGLVFDSAVYTPLSDVSPVTYGDSHVSGMQHMGVIKDFSITYTVTNSSTGAPVITAQPQSQTAEPGSNATFTVVATGAPTLRYQWRFGATELANATASSLTLTNVQAFNAGSYAVVITNSAGNVTSTAAILSVGTAPLITAQPQNQSVNAGATASFTVSATGTLPLAYQWRRNGTNLTAATASNYSQTNVTTNDAGSYSVVISNAVDVVTSADAVLTVVVDSGTVIAQWDFNSPTPDGTTTTGTLAPSTGSGSASYLGGTKPAGTTDFASGSGSADPNSSDNSAWNTSTYPASSAGNKSAGVKFTASTAGKQNINIRWDQKQSTTGSKYFRLRYTTNGTDFIDFPTAVSVAGTTFESKTNSLAGFSSVNDNPNFAFQIVAEFESTAARTANANYVGASGTYASTGTARFDMVTIYGNPIPTATPPNITAQPASQTANQGASATFSVLVTGTAPLSYQWRFNSSPIGGATTSAYTRSNIQPTDIGSYSVVVSNSAGTVTSSNATLSLLVPAPILVMQSPQVIAVAGPQQPELYRPDKDQLRPDQLAHRGNCLLPVDWGVVHEPNRRRAATLPRHLSLTTSPPG